MRVLTGTSGFSYDEWKGSFYPPELPAAGRLHYYAERLPTVEINNTFYRMPTSATLAGWAAQVPPAFTFALKASQRITHQKRLKDVGDAVAFFFRAAEALGQRLGPVLFQLPPNMKQDLARLHELLELVPPGARAALEFRHPSWFEDPVYQSLRAHGAALCFSESEDLAAPPVATAGWGYLRLRRDDYAEADLVAWAERIRAQPWSEAFVYFKHEEAGKGPRLAARLAAILG